jgi:hypothetical protein
LDGLERALETILGRGGALCVLASQLALLLGHLLHLVADAPLGVVLAAIPELLHLALQASLLLRELGELLELLLDALRFGLEVFDGTAIEQDLQELFYVFDRRALSVDRLAGLLALQRRLGLGQAAKQARVLEVLAAIGEQANVVLAFLLGVAVLETLHQAIQSFGTTDQLLLLEQDLLARLLLGIRARRRSLRMQACHRQPRRYQQQHGRSEEDEGQAERRSGERANPGRQPDQNAAPLGTHGVVEHGAHLLLVPKSPRTRSIRSLSESRIWRVMRMTS